MPKVDFQSAAEPITGNQLVNPTWFKFFEQIWSRIGGASQYNLGGTLVVSTASVGNVGTGEDNLISYTLPRNTISATGDRLVIKAFGTFAANGNNKTVKLHIGSTQLFSTGAIAANNKDWCIESEIIRTSGTTQEIITNCYTDSTLVGTLTDYVSGSEDFATALVIKCTGEATSNDDIIQKGLTINLFPRG